ncbi:MAG: hypothetical protein D6B25_00005 [Desulfobulbaceae bacterium]|nr:MAG: hypothetical protein D6B25_00005 [Desulfobulbaceae bacterium]
MPERAVYRSITVLQNRKVFLPAPQPESALSQPDLIRHLSSPPYAGSRACQPGFKFFQTNVTTPIPLIMMHFWLNRGSFALLL